MRKSMFVFLMVSVSFASSVFAGEHESNLVRPEVKAGEHNRPGEFAKGSVTCRFERQSDESEKSESSNEQGTAGSAR